MEHRHAFYLMCFNGLQSGFLLRLVLPLANRSSQPAFHPSVSDEGLPSELVRWPRPWTLPAPASASRSSGSFSWERGSELPRSCLWGEKAGRGLIGGQTGWQPPEELRGRVRRAGAGRPSPGRDLGQVRPWPGLPPNRMRCGCRCVTNVSRDDAPGTFPAPPPELVRTREGRGLQGAGRG